MVIVPAHNLVLVGVGLLFKGVINHQGALCRLHLTHKRLDRRPQVGRGFLGAGQVSGHLVMADLALQKLGQPDGRGRAKGRQQVIGI